MHNVKVPTKIPSDRGLGGWHQNFTGVPYNYTPNPRGCLTHVKKFYGPQQWGQLMNDWGTLTTILGMTGDTEFKWETLIRWPPFGPSFPHLD